MQNNWEFILIGDQKSPKDFVLDGCNFYSIEKQLATELSFAKLCPANHYSRKNIGYLLSIQNGAKVIVETDDDNFPEITFWNERKVQQDSYLFKGKGWVNIYKYFTDENIWPRGYPLDLISKNQYFTDLKFSEKMYCPIQQGLADDNPDVDAVYRLVLPLPITFNTKENIVLSSGSWCPFNSQNTTWFPDAFPLMYLPTYCSFRMTDIWRSFVAQRIAWANDWGVLFHQPTVYQERNEHDLMRDFAQEVPGYLNNCLIAVELEKLTLTAGKENMTDNLLLCYELLVKLNFVQKEEIKLVESWISDIKKRKNS